MNRSFLFFVLSALLFVSFNNVFSQEPAPIKWGEIPMADLQMKSFPQDTNATALILCDYGESYFNDDFAIVYNRHLRVKILTTKGYEWGTHSVSLYTDDHAESIHDIEGVTYRLDDKGSIVKTELEKKDIFEEEINDSYTRYKFTLPALQPGCVIEIRYKIVANSIYYMRGWVFQHSEPVRWSEYRMRYPKNIAYSNVTRGYEPLAVDENEEVTQVFSGTASSYLHGTIVNCAQRRWVLKNAPAIREEPYITTTDDYINKIDVQLAGYSFPETGTKRVLNDWPTVVKELLDNKYFYGRIDDTRQVRKLAEKITAGLQSPQEKIKAIYDWVRTSIVWSGDNARYADQEVDDLLESKKGNNAEITFLLLSLLKSVDIAGDPVILSTRGHGAIQDIYPILSQFNYVIARVILGTKVYLLDATDPYRPMHILPFKVLNTRGLVIQEKNPGWINVAADDINQGSSSASITVAPDGSISGNFEESLSEYGSIRLRQKLSDKKEIDIAKDEFESERSGITIDSVSISNKDSIYLPLKIRASFSSASYAQKNGDMIYINPQIIDRIWENPLKTAVRKYPVDYGYKSRYTTTITLTIPDGFEVKGKPKDFSTYANARAQSFTRLSKVEGNKIIINCVTETRETIVKPKFYDQLRDYYASIVSGESEQIVLSRIQAPAAAPAAVPAAAPAQGNNSRAELPADVQKAKSKVKKGKG